MTTYRIYRDLPGKPRQYIAWSRLNGEGTGAIIRWSSDHATAKRHPEHQARTVVTYLRRRMVGDRQHPPNQPAGNYDMEAV